MLGWRQNSPRDSDLKVITIVFPGSKYLRFTELQRDYGQKLQIVVAGHYISRYLASKKMKFAVSDTMGSNRHAACGSPMNIIHTYIHTNYVGSATNSPRDSDLKVVIIVSPGSKSLRFIALQREYGQKLQVVVAGHYI